MSSDDPTRLSAPIADDDTRLSDVKSPSSPSGWLSSSGAIDHGRLPPGTILGNRYRIVGRLGRGGMGEDYRADDLKLGQPVALKCLPSDVDRDPGRLTQLHTEVRMARQVSHPNVCRVYDIDEVDGHTFLSMEYGTPAYMAPEQLAGNEVTMGVFLRFGLLALASALYTIQVINVVPLTIDLSRPHAGISVLAMLIVAAMALYGFHISRAGEGLLRRLVAQA